MGKATVLSGGEDGRYQVRLELAREAIEAEIARINAEKIPEVEGKITQAQAEFDAKDVEVAQIAAELDAAISALALDPATGRLEPMAPVTDAQKRIAKAQIERSAARRVLDRLKADRLSLRLRLDYLQSVPPDPEKEVWCADLTEDIAPGATVGTIDIPGEGVEQVLIAPGFEGAATYAAERDGAMTPREAMSPEQAFLNAALLPGWQKFRPLHRVGTIRDIDAAANRCGVDLDEALSSAQGLQINQGAALEDVPVRYMDCDAEAFEDGDRVVVAFSGQDWSAPEVIGFEKEPKPCALAYVMTEWLQWVSESAVYSWAVVSLVNVKTRSVIEAWARQMPYETPPEGLISYNKQPYVGIGPRGGQVSQHTAGGQTYRRLFDATQLSPDVAFSPPLLDPQQHDGRLYGILYDNYALGGPSSADAQQFIVELQSGVEVGRWRAWPADGYAYTFSVAYGRAAIGGYFGNDYRVRVFDLSTRAQIVEIVCPGFVQSVRLSRKYLSVMLGILDDDTLMLYRADNYGFIGAYPLDKGGGSFAYDHDVIGDRVIVTAGYIGQVRTYLIGDQGASLTYEGAMFPWESVVSQLPGLDGTGFTPVTAWARAVASPAAPAGV